MKKSLKAWVDDIGRIELPVFEQTLTALVPQKNALPDASGSKIASIVLPDPFMVLKAMCMANTGRGGRFSQPILTVGHAVMMVGFTPSLDKMLAAPALEKTTPPQVRTGLLAVAARAYHAAYHARDWAVMRLDTNVEEVYIAALLQELGAMVMWHVATDAMVELNRRYRKQDRIEAEQAVLGFALDDLTLALLQAWNLPPLISSALRSSECEAHARVRLVALARELARQTERGWYDDDLMLDIAVLAETLRMSVDETLARVHRVAADAARVRTFAGVTPAATWLPMLPGEWPDEEASQSAAPVVPAPTDTSPPPDPYQHALAQMAAQGNGTLNLNGLMTLVIRGMQQGIGLKRVVFALMTQDRLHLQAKFVVGAGESEALRQFRFALGAPTLISKVLEKQQAFWLNDETRVKVERLLDTEVQRITASRHFFIMSIGVNGKIIGLFYADAGEGNHPLATEAYDKFRKLCGQAAVSMASLAKS